MDTLIAEDFLMLLLDDDKGHIAGETTLQYTLGGAVLIELALRGRATVEPSQSVWRSALVHTSDGPELGDAILDAAFATVAEKPRPALELILRIGTHLRSELTTRLVERGLVRRETKKFLGLIPSTTWPTEDPAHEDALRGRLRAALTEGAEPAARDAAVIALLLAAQQLSVLGLGGGKEGKAVRARATEIAEGAWAADAVATAITAANVAIIAATTAAVSTAVVTVVTTPK